MVKIVTAEEMARIEQIAFKEGFSQEDFIEAAGRSVAEEVCKIEYSPSKCVTLLVGKGGNGADAYVAGQYLLKESFTVNAIAPFPFESCSPLNQKEREKFLQLGGMISSQKELQGILVDGLLGTGYRGELDPLLKELIEQVNQTKTFVISIDIPSGVHGTTGKVPTSAIYADITIGLGNPKLGLFLNEGPTRTGKLMVKSFGLPKVFTDQAFAVGELWEQTWPNLPRLIANRHKYEAGYVVGLAGSSLFPGAAKLAGMAALRSGAGMVRIFHQEPLGVMPSELIFQKWSRKAWDCEIMRASALFLGPGAGALPKGILKTVKLPCVLDADALQPKMVLPKQAILTPHPGEMRRLLNMEQVSDEELLVACQAFVDKTGVLIVLKGMPTKLFMKNRVPLFFYGGDPGMATAGSGDVLTGMIASWLSQGLSCEEAAIMGIALHQKSGEIAAKKWTSYGMIATDLIESLAEALKPLSKLHQSCF